MTDVDRRASKGRFGWLRGKDKPSQPGKLAKGGPRRMPVSGPRQMGQSVSVDSFDTKDVQVKGLGISSEPPSPVVLESRNSWAVPKTSEIRHEMSFERLPAWAYKSGEWDTTPIPPQPRYNIHEPNGPAWYINHHLRPPPSAHPRTSFPPSAFSPASNQTQSQGSSSQQARSNYSIPRLYTDTVDSLDVSDPHGTRWHHASPYELGRKASARPRSGLVGPGVGTYAGAIEGSEPLEQTLSNSPSASSLTSTPNGRLIPRSRNSSSARLAPSPLSQSTSANDLGKSSADLGSPPSLPPSGPINLNDDAPAIASVANVQSTEKPSESFSIAQSPADRPLPRSRSTSPIKPTSESPPSDSQPPPTAKAEPEPKKLAKRDTAKRTGAFLGMFASSSNSSGPPKTSPPVRKRSVSVTMFDAQRNEEAKLLRNRSRRASNSAATRPTSPPVVVPATISAPTPLKPPVTKAPQNPLARLQTEEKREKRGSILGRLVKKFSTARKTSHDEATQPRGRKTSLSTASQPQDSPRPSIQQSSSATGSTFTPPPSTPIVTSNEDFIPPSRELPHHLPTPQLSSPLVLHPPIFHPPTPSASPSPEQQPTMALTITNPDVPSTPPSPPPRSLPAVEVQQATPPSKTDANLVAEAQLVEERLKGESRSNHGHSADHRRSIRDSSSAFPTPSSARHEQPLLQESEERERRRSSSPSKESRSTREERHREREIQKRSSSESPTKKSSSRHVFEPESRRRSGSTPSTPPLQLRERRSNAESLSHEQPSSSSRQPKERPSLRSLPSAQGISSSSTSGQSSAVPPVPRSVQPSPSSRRKRPSLETISAMGKEWEVVPDTRHSSSRHHRSRSGEERHRQSPDKAEQSLKTSAENAWTGPPSSSHSRHGHKGRRSTSVDSSITSSSRRPPTQPPTPPPKTHLSQSPRPPTTGPSGTSRRSQTPPSRRSSPSPTTDKSLISAPVPMGRARSRRESSSVTHSRSSHAHASPSSKPNGARPQRQSTSRPPKGSQHQHSMSTEDLTGSRDPNPRAKEAWERERLRKGQSWSASEASRDTPPRLQLPMSIVRTDNDRDADSKAGVPSTSESANGSGALVARAGSSHTSFQLQAPLAPSTRGQTGVAAPTIAYGYPGQQVAYDRQGRITALPYYQAPGTMQHSQSYSHPQQSRFGYEVAPPPGTSPEGAPRLTQSTSLPAGYPPSSSLPATQLNAYTPNSSQGTYVQFSSRAPYPIAPYPQPNGASWGQYTSQQ